MSVNGDTPPNKHESICQVRSPKAYAVRAKSFAPLLDYVCFLDRGKATMSLSKWYIYMSYLRNFEYFEEISACGRAQVLLDIVNGLWCKNQVLEDHFWTPNWNPGHGGQFQTRNISTFESTNRSWKLVPCDGILADFCQKTLTFSRAAAL